MGIPADRQSTGRGRGSGVIDPPRRASIFLAFCEGEAGCEELNVESPTTASHRPKVGSGRPVIRDLAGVVILNWMGSKFTIAPLVDGCLFGDEALIVF